MTKLNAKSARRTSRNSRTAGASQPRDHTRRPREANRPGRQPRDSGPVHPPVRKVGGCPSGRCTGHRSVAPGSSFNQKKARRRPFIRVVVTAATPNLQLATTMNIAFIAAGHLPADLDPLQRAALAAVAGMILNFLVVLPGMIKNDSSRQLKKTLLAVAGLVNVGHYYLIGNTIESGALLALVSISLFVLGCDRISRRRGHVGLREWFRVSFRTYSD